MIVPKMMVRSLEWSVLLPDGGEAARYLLFVAPIAGFFLTNNV